MQNLWTILLTNILLLAYFMDLDTFVADFMNLFTICDSFSGLNILFVTDFKDLIIFVTDFMD